MNRVIRITAFVAIILAVLLSPACAHAASPQNILFVGNSFTHAHFAPAVSYNSGAITDENGDNPPFGGVPGIFKKMVGESYNVAIEAINGATLAQHYNSTKETAIMADPKWNIIVLQENSTVPLPVAHGGVPDKFNAAADDLRKLILAKNPSAKIFLYETWASPTTVSTNGYANSANNPTAQLHAMQTDLQNAYFAAKYTLGFNGVARVGDAFLLAVDQGWADPTGDKAPGTFDLWGPDSRHPSAYGAYLSAAVYYAKITQQDPRKLSTGPDSAAAGLGISATDAAHLQTIAYQISQLADPAEKH